MKAQTPPRGNLDRRRALDGQVLWLGSGGVLLALLGAAIRSCEHAAAGQIPVLMCGPAPNPLALPAPAAAHCAGCYLMVIGAVLLVPAAMLALRTVLRPPR
jgi:hypothetical protein